MGTFTLYNQFLLKQNNGNAIDLDTADIRLSIHTNSYVPNQAHAFFSDAAPRGSGKQKLWRAIGRRCRIDRRRRCTRQWRPIWQTQWL